MIALDTNFLVYAESRNDPNGKDVIARGLLRQLSVGGGIIPMQVFGEFLNACHAKKVLSLEDAVVRAEEGNAVFETPFTTVADLRSAAGLLRRFNLQFFDALIVTVAARAGATMLLSEDMHDGLRIDDLRILNPFNPANEADIEAQLIQFGA